jgi:membrane-associated protein TcaA
MRCANCGEYVDSTQLYCTNCGAKQEPVQEKAGQGGRRNKKFFLLLGVFLLLLCSVVAVHFTLSYRFDPERLVFRLEEAVKEQNPKQLINLLEKDNPNIKWTEGNAKRFLQYINEEADVHQIFAELAKQAHNPNAYHMFTPVTDRNGNDLFVLVKGEKKFGIYQQYYIEVIPFRLVVSSNLDNVDVKIDQTKKTLSNSDEKYKLGQFLPGAYKMTATYQSDYATMSKDFTLDFSRAEENELNYYAEMEASFVSITSNVEKAELFVNGKGTGKTIQEMNSFGPIDKHQSIALHAEYQNENGRIKTDEVTVTGEDHEVYLEFNEMELEALHWDEIVQNDEAYFDASIGSFMENFLSSSVSSYNEGDFSIIEPYLNEDGPISKELKKYIDHVVSKGIKENLVDFQVTNCKWSDEGITVFTQEEYEIYYNDGTAKKKKFKSEYLLKRVGDQYKVHSLLNTTTVSSEDL